ncbi:MAG: AsmA family protein, partial [Gammaproteobacteria bacterium]
MKKIIKITAITTAIILLLLVISPFIVAMIIDPNDYKEDISKLVFDKTGRTLTIKGDLNYSLFPWLGVNLGELQLSNSSVKGFSKTAFAKIKSADVRVKIMPLFNGKVEVDKIVLAGLNLTLEKNKHGVTNWQDLITKTQANSNAQKPAPTTKQTTPDPNNPDNDANMILPAIAG